MDGVDGWCGWMVLVDGWVAWMVWMNGWCGWMVWMGGVDGWTDDVGGWLSLTLFLISYKRRGEREGDEIQKTPNCPSHQVLHVPLLPVAKLSLTLFPISYKRRGEREGDEIKQTTSNCRTSASGQTPCHHATQQYTNRCFADLNNSQPESSVKGTIHV